ncbi:MAG TPA: hypothetical protein VMR81_07885 [Patescibacteria group bacterium]|nr:hypothetical protein [Patescibacteria group bacterium]
MKKAQVFISCGQKDDSEKVFGEYLEKYFVARGFDTYFAEEVHSSKPLLLSIFDALKESEYFVSVNPHRKETGDTGSIFVQQEIAVASSLRMPIIAFHQKGVRRTNGMSGGLHLNSIEVNEPREMKHLLGKVTALWDNTSRNQLFLKIANPSLNILNQNSQLTNWWHISCRNGSSLKHAKGCMAYIDKIFGANRKNIITIPYKCEIVWAGVGIHSITIAKKTERDFDAIFTFNGSGVWHPQILQTSTIYKYPSLTDGIYNIEYLVVSDNFPDARLLVKLKLQKDIMTVIKQRQL